MKLTPKNNEQKNNLKLELEIYFNNPKQISQKVWKVREMIEDGCFTYNDINIKYQVLRTVEPVYRLEEHDGVQYIVFESKMNRQ